MSDTIIASIITGAVSLVVGFFLGTNIALELK